MCYTLKFNFVSTKPETERESYKYEGKICFVIFWHTNEWYWTNTNSFVMIFFLVGFCVCVHVCMCQYILTTLISIAIYVCMWYSGGQTLNCLYQMFSHQLWSWCESIDWNSNFLNFHVFNWFKRNFTNSFGVC